MTSFLSRRDTVRQDLLASIVVFLVALPLCIGVAVASGVPAELGLITGIVGGLVAGALPGSSLQVSGPAAGLTVLVFEAVREYGLRSLGAIVIAAGLIQLGMGALRLGRWFRAISISVVQGMLAGIGLVLVTGQVHGLFDGRSPGAATANVAGLPGLLTDSANEPAALAAGGIGIGTIVVLVCWKYAPKRLRVVPGALVAVALATLATLAFDLPVKRIEVKGLLGSIQPPGLSDLGGLASVGVLGTVVAFALIASAESLFSAAAVDRMHNGSRTDYDRELIAQGAGNTLCGLLGALPMTAVIVRSAANVQAGARTKASRILHGVWLLAFTAIFPAALGHIPVTALAAILVHAGWKLLSLREVGRLWRTERGEAVVLTGTALAIVVTNLFEGVLIGLLLAIVKTAWDVSDIHVDVDEKADPLVIRLSGNATFLRLPKVLDTLEAIPHGRAVELDLSALRHLDHACRTALQAWAAQHDGRDEKSSVRMREPALTG
ncbi:SulP family inorganic anion transporter [Actinoallomurus purpureus]|uniref:SulP family inorganic anion transporter n=1 Tax=Actinoallomurus purpureus TaxID=478114 RepID=UPI0020927A13|nr:SulP family inorganic anion transporter [Actinoallomurus purpureus]MCO6009073.1 SulP family inorganic anion transporter [Actinoallomurus purpureus]